MPRHNRVSAKAGARVQISRTAFFSPAPRPGDTLATCRPACSVRPEEIVMRKKMTAMPVTLLLGIVACGGAQPPAGQPDKEAPKYPPPGTRGNADNVPFIGKSSPKGGPVRLAKASGHVSNYDEAKVPPFALPDPLVTF